MESIVAEPSKDDIEALKNMLRSEPDSLHFSVGTEITAPNDHRVTPVHDDEVSEYIIEGLWYRLRRDDGP